MQRCKYYGCQINVFINALMHSGINCNFKKLTQQHTTTILRPFVRDYPPTILIIIQLRCIYHDFRKATSCAKTCRSIDQSTCFFLHSSPFYPAQEISLQCFSIGQIPQKCPFPWGESTSPCNACSPDPPDSAFQTTFQWFSRFCTIHSRESLYFTVCIKT